MPELSGYVLETLWEDGELVVSRGVRDGEPSPLLVVAPASSEPAPGTITRLEHAWALRDELDPTWAARPRALVRHRGRPALLLEDPGGEPLARLLGQPWEVTPFLRVAIGLATVLGRLHERGLIHKDVKPAHILVNAATGAVWLTGFGIASRLPRERQTPEPPEVIAGTLAYMAPEQTGRMNRSIDSRSDLYACGVTLYEMLTAALPFSAADPMGWVHCHIARRPTPPGERASRIPGPLSAIVMKLLAKTAEERYQTSAGVAADLRRCRAEWEANGRIDPFPLGAQDVPDRLLIPETLYGREREIDALLAAFDRVVAQGTPELVLVSGYSGVGKSSVVNELHKVLVPPRGLFASGKFDQYKRDIPYATLAQAFQGLVRSLLGRSEAELGRWRAALGEALGPNGQLIVDLVPELELVIGTQPPVADLPPQVAKNRFRMVFRRFLGVFARPEHPLALFLDDLQWLDAATLDLLEDLVTHSEVRHLLLVGAYRDNEVGPAHPLLRTLEAIREAGGRVQEITLTPLGLDDVGRLVADALHCEPEPARPLAQLVHEKTGGNPFFAIQFFTTLAEEELLAFDRATTGWVWDIDRIDAKDYTDNVVDLMVRKLKRLPPPTQDALKHLACLGNMAEIGTLSMVHQQTEEAIHAALWEAVRAGLIVHQGNNYKFLHDRIQQAAYSLIPEQLRAEVHLSIGRVLQASLTADTLTEQLFEVANQFNRGTALLTNRTEKTDVATLNLRTGRKAKASAAYASARKYFATGIALLDERDWESHHELTFSLSLERAECELLCGNLEKAEQLIGELLQRTASRRRVRGRLLPEDQFACIDGRTPASHRQRARVPASVRHRPAGTPYLRAGPGRIRDGVANPRRAPDRESDRSAADDRSENTGSHAGALSPCWPCHIHRLSVVLPARVPHGERQHTARGERRFRLRLCLPRVCPWSELSPLPRRLPPGQACLRPGREARIHRLRHEGLPCDGTGRLLDGADHERDRTPSGDHSHRHGERRSDFRLLRHAPNHHIFAYAERSARCGVARVGDGAGLRSESQVPRCRGPHREPATLHREHAGSRCDLLYLQRRAIRRGGVRSATDVRTDADRDLLVLDSQTQGAVPLRRLRRGPGGGRQGEGAALDLSRTVAAVRLLLLHRADGGGTL